MKRANEVVSNNRSRSGSQSNGSENPTLGGSSNITDLLAAFGETLALERRARSTSRLNSPNLSGSNLDGSNIQMKDFLNSNGSTTALASVSEDQDVSLHPNYGFSHATSPRLSSNRLEVEDGSHGREEGSGGGGERFGSNNSRRRTSVGSRTGKQPPSPLLRELFLGESQAAANMSNSHSSSNV